MGVIVNESEKKKNNNAKWLIIRNNVMHFYFPHITLVFQRADKEVLFYSLQIAATYLPQLLFTRRKLIKINLAFLLVR